jgi:hypothetical protein
MSFWKHLADERNARIRAEAALAAACAEIARLEAEAVDCKKLRLLDAILSA